MKLVKARVQNYRSVEDSGEFEVGEMTCLVGKNEAGKTAREPFIFYMAVLAVYLFITWISTTLFEAMERRYAAPLAHAR